MNANCSEGEEEDETICVAAPETSARSCQIFVPPSDIDWCIGFSKLRWLLSTIGFLLMLTDIPRTGLGLSSLKDYYKVVGLDTVMYFGPHAYPVAHFYTETSADGKASEVDKVVKATSGGTKIATVDIWAYKFDSLSIPMRALAIHLGVSAYPRCVLHLEPCAQSVLSLRSVFEMLDSIIGAFAAKYIQPSRATRTTADFGQFSFGTRSTWIDRLHHYLVKPIWKHSELRTHTVQFFDASNQLLRSSVCDTEPGGPLRPHTARPWICDLPVVWRCDHPNGASLNASQVPIWDHISLRIEALRTQYPSLEVDLTLITSRLLLLGSRHKRTPGVKFTAETIEITTLIRGRECVSPAAVAAANNSAPCRTVFVDDYRYERATIISDAEQWSRIAGGLRGGGQTFMWLRFIFLCVGCYRARATEKKFRRASWGTKLYATWLTISKIPSFAIVYGSWFPVSCYAVAHFLDSALIHLISNTVWSTINGVVEFQPIKYLTVASIQMRNIWMLALLMRFVMMLRQHFSRSRHQRWVSRHGVIGVRGLIFGAISSLTVFSCLRARRFRDSSVIEIFELSDQALPNGFASFGFSNVTNYGFYFDCLTLSISTVVVMLVLPFVQLIKAICTGDPCVALTCQSYYVPLNAEALWPSGCLFTHWRMRLVEAPIDLQQSGDQSVRRCFPSRCSLFATTSTSSVAPASLTTGANGRCRASCKFRKAKHSWWHIVQGCPRHDTLLDVVRRRKEHWSALRLMNIAMLTDPFVLLQLYVFGHEMLIYRAKALSSHSSTTYSRVRSDTGDGRQARTSSHHDDGPRLPEIASGRLFVSPFFLKGETHRSAMKMFESELWNYEFVGSTTSALLPWTVLVSSG